MIRKLLKNCALLVAFNDITVSAVADSHPKLGTSLQSHPFLNESPDLQYKSFESHDEKGFSLRLHHTRKEQKKSHHLSARSARQELANTLNYIYTGSLWMGKGGYKQEMRINFDTGSDWLVVETTDCRTCLENRYDPDFSSSFNRYWFGTNTEM